mgnify:CR=1 FL=1
MHRHGYKGRKFGRERDQRRALLKGLATSLVEHGKIETTLPKAKELVRYIEKLITKAKKGDLAARRELLKHMSPELAKKMVEVIAVKYKDRPGGYTRILKTGPRKSDGARMAIIELV